MTKDEELLKLASLLNTLSSDLDDASVYEFSDFIQTYSDEVKAAQFYLLQDLVDERTLCFFNAANDMEPSKDDGGDPRISEESYDLYKLANNIVDTCEKCVLLSNAAENLELVKYDYSLTMDTISIITSKLPQKDKIIFQGPLDSLHQDIGHTQHRIRILEPTTPVSTMIWRCLMVLLCAASLGALLLVPAVANFFTGYLLVIGLCIGGCALFIILWKNNGFWLGYLMLMGIALAVSIPGALLVMWLGIATVERLVIVVIPAFGMFHSICNIVSSLRKDISIREKRAEITQWLNQIRRYAEFCLAHSRRIGMEANVVAHYEKTLNTIEQMERDVSSRH